MPDGLRFEWEPRKAARNRAKHQVSFEEALTADPRHSAAEERMVLIGQSERGRLLVVMFTECGDAIRLISTREATRRERRSYEQSEG